MECKIDEKLLNTELIQNEEYRLATFGVKYYPIDSRLLAMAGFYYVNKNVKCFKCGLCIDETIKGTDDIVMIHKERSPECSFAQELFTFANLL